MACDDDPNRPFLVLKRARSAAARESAFAEVYRVCFGDACRYGRRRYPAISDADVNWVVNGAFKDFYEAIGRGRAWRGNPLAYLQKIVWRKLYGFFHKQHYARLQPFDHTITEPTDTGSDPGRRADAADFYRRIAQVVEQMPKRRREAGRYLIAANYSLKRAVDTWLANSPNANRRVFEKRLAAVLLQLRPLYYEWRGIPAPRARPYTKRKPANQSAIGSGEAEARETPPPLDIKSHSVAASVVSHNWRDNALWGRVRSRRVAYRRPRSGE